MYPMENETPLDDGFSPTDPGFGADASSEPEPAETVEAEAEAEEQVEVEESEAESPPAVEEDDEKKTDAFQGRIDKLTSSFRESERRADSLQEHNAQLQKQLDEVPVPETPAKTLADFNYDEAQYQQYIFGESQRRATDAADRAVRGFREEQRVESVGEKFDAREKEFEPSVDDYQATVYADSLRINTGMKVEIQESDIGPAMAYYLGKNVDEATRISKLTPREIIREMATLESSLRTEMKNAKGKKVSDAPPPPAKVKGSDPGNKPAPTDPKSDKLSDAEWFKAEEKRTAKQRG